MHPEGTYDARVVDHVVSTTKAGKFQVLVEVETREGTAIMRLSLEGGAGQYTVDKLRRLGWQGRRFAELNERPPALKGRACRVEISHEEWEGKTQVRCDLAFGLYVDEAAGEDADRVFGDLLEPPRSAPAPRRGEERPF